MSDQEFWEAVADRARPVTEEQLVDAMRQAVELYKAALRDEIEQLPQYEFHWACCDDEWMTVLNHSAVLALLEAK
jgi:hypothetical protein